MTVGPTSLDAGWQAVAAAEPVAAVAADPWLSIVIPAFNEAGRIGRSMQRIRDYVARKGWAAELIVIDDGSRDGTARIVREFDGGPLAVRLLVNAANAGKGYSVRRGMLAARGTARLMSDADLSAPIEELDKLLAWLDRFSVVIGSRDLPDSVVCPPQPRLRRAIAAAFRGFRRRLLLTDLRDTQCGFKCFSGAAAEAIFQRVKTRGFALDLEVLGLARRMGLGIREVGIAWGDDRDSRVRAVRDGLRVLASLPGILWRLRKTSQERNHEAGYSCDSTTADQ